MTNNLSDRDAPAGTRNRELLAQIAALLSEPEAVFFQDNAASKAYETAQMLRLWHKLATAADRRKLLALARTLAAVRT